MVQSPILPPPETGAHDVPATKPRKNVLKRSAVPAGDSLCDHCAGKCCRYFTLPIDAPKSRDDYDSVRWYLAHGRTLVYVDKATWYLVVMTRCNYLSADDRCGIYHERPRICREYTTAECEYDDDWIFEKVFETPEQLWEYAEAVLTPRQWAKGRPARAAVPASGLVVLGDMEARR